MYGYEIGISIVSIMIAIGGIVYGFGYAFDIRRLKDFGRNELIESFINAALLAVLVALFMPGGLITGITNSIAYGVSGTTCSGLYNYSYPICFAENYLVGPLGVSINGNNYPSLFIVTSGSLLTISGLYAVAGLVSSIHLSIGVASMSFTSIFKPFLMQLGDVIEMLTLSIMSIFMQYSIIKVVSYVAVPVLLPIGMVLRTLYVTRRLGGAIMAIAISLFVVLPMSYLLDASMMQSYSQTSVSQFSSSISSQLKGLYQTNSSPLNSNSISSSSILSGVSGVLSDSENLLLFIFREAVILVVEIIIFPVFSIILTVISARELARVLGTEVSFSKFNMF